MPANLDTPRDAAGLTADDHALLKRLCDKQPKLFLQGHEGYYAHSDISAAVQLIARLATPAAPPQGEDDQLHDAINQLAEALADASGQRFVLIRTSDLREALAALWPASAEGE